MNYDGPKDKPVPTFEIHEMADDEGGAEEMDASGGSSGKRVRLTDQSDTGSKRPMGRDRAKAQRSGK